MREGKGRCSLPFSSRPHFSLSPLFFPHPNQFFRLPRRDIFGIPRAQWNDNTRPKPPRVVRKAGFKRAVILSNGKGQPLSKLVPNIPVGPNRSSPFHLMYQTFKFWVEWKAPKYAGVIPKGIFGNILFLLSAPVHFSYCLNVKLLAS